MTITTTIHPTLEAPIALRSSLSVNPRTRDRHDDLAAFPAAVRSEWIKIRSLRSTPAIVGLTVIMGVLLSWIIATFVKTDPYKHQPFTIGQTFIFSTWLSTVLAVVMGTLMFTSEVEHGTLAGVVTAQPARWVTVAAKATMGACLGLVMGVAGMIAGFGGAVLGGLHTGNTSSMASTALWGLLLTSLAPVFGLGVGMILRHSAAATSTVLIWALVVENLIRGFAPPSVSHFMPFSAANGLLAIRSAGDTEATVAAALSRLQDAFLFSGYSLLFIAIGTALLYRRDTN